MNERGGEISVRKSNDPLVKRVLYGAFDAGKKALESQSPDAWSKRIMKVVDEKIVPKLSPKQQQWADEHREGIKEAATLAGVGITTGEIVLATVVVDKGIRAIVHRIDLLKEYREDRKLLPYVEPLEFPKDIPKDILAQDREKIERITHIAGGTGDRIQKQLRRMEILRTYPGPENAQKRAFILRHIDVPGIEKYFPNFGLFSERLQQAIDAAIPRSESRSATKRIVLSSLLTEAHEQMGDREIARMVLGIKDSFEPWADPFSDPLTKAKKLFHKMSTLVPRDDQQILHNAGGKKYLDQLAKLWLDSLHRVGLNVVIGTDIRDAINSAEKLAKTII